MRAKVAEIGADRVAVFICEPVQGSGAPVIVPPTGFLSAMQATCRELDILFVVDEVITGFGRTGRMFAAEHEGLMPDLMTLAKGLYRGLCAYGRDAGFGPRVRRDCRRRVRRRPVRPRVHIFRPSGERGDRPGSHAPLPEDGLLANGQAVGAYFGERLREFIDHPLVGDVRSQGLLAGLELVIDTCKRKPSKDVRLGARLFDIGYRNGLIFRAFARDTIGFAPPLCITTDEVDLLMERLRQTLDTVLDMKELRQ